MSSVLRFVGPTSLASTSRLASGPFLEHDVGLQCGDWEALAEPADDLAELEPYDTDLPSIILSVLGDNPAMKSEGLDRLETHLESSDRLPVRQVYGLLLESCESSKVSRAQSQRFQWMLFDMWRSMRLLIKFPA